MSGGPWAGVEGKSRGLENQGQEEAAPECPLSLPALPSSLCLVGSPAPEQGAEKTKDGHPSKRQSARILGPQTKALQELAQGAGRSSGAGDKALRLSGTPQDPALEPREPS